MDKVKTINLLSLDRLNLEEQASRQDYFRMSDDAIVIINGDIHKAQLFNKEEIYQLMEPRFLLAMQGWGDVCINLQNYHIEKGNIIITGPDTIIEVNEISDDARIAGIVFRESIKVPEEIVLKTSPTESAWVLRLVYLLWDVIQLKPYRRKTAQDLLQAVVSGVQEIKGAEDDTIQSGGLTRAEELFIRFKRLVHQHCKEQRSIPFYADQLHVTPHHLSALIKKISNQSVMYWINRATIQEAKILLKTNELMAYEVADRLKFPTASAFSKFFKRETGITPRMYQEHLRND